MAGMTQPSNAVKMAVIYYSSTGTNQQMAETAAEAARAAGAEVRVLKVHETAPQEVIDGQDAWKAQQQRSADIPEASLDDLEWADALIFSTPTRYGGAASQLRAFLDTTGPLWGSGKLAGKTVSAMTSAQNPNGGQETTLQGLYVAMMHWGTIITAPGYTDQSVFAAGGNPYGASVTATGGPLSETDRAHIAHQARRQVEITGKLKG